MQVLPPIVTPSPAPSTSSSSSGGTDDGFLSILAEALTALAGEHGDPAAESDADGAVLAPAVEADDLDGVVPEAVLVATLPAPELAGVGTDTIDPSLTGAAEGALAAEPALEPTGPLTVTPVDVTVDVATPVEGEVPPTAVAGDGSDALASSSARATDPTDAQVAAPAPTDSERAGGSTDEALRVPGWVSAAGESATSTTRAAESAAAAPAPAPAASAPAPVADLQVLPPTPTATAVATASTQPTSVAATMAAADLAAFEAAEGDSPWQQLASVVRPLRQLPDGSHRLSLQLRPAELGAVHLEVALEDGRLSLRALAENVATREVLAASLPELRAELARSGIDLGSLDVGDQTFGPGGDAEQGSGTAAEPTPRSGETSTAATTSTAHGDAPAADSSSRLDLTL